ncbi:MAG: hypothetical protein A3I01_06385 [Betaproteobacteria bacterium RIFCSPLOWO2_02_FULL_65_24]|nr:MAG: hypothetical protein A3I01_06385 [Betaproteobacteria bacterium RIFCSPLOWO2_02_FULL_65_24]OGA78612.1 MAG: hypothetical protein A3G27_11180 [Betaproteobacteria bacterium RIFCSPLOWO2_12_FULL_66_14]
MIRFPALRCTLHGWLAAWLLAACVAPAPEPVKPAVTEPPLAVVKPAAPEAPALPPVPAPLPEPAPPPKEVLPPTPAELEARLVIELIGYAHRVATLPVEEQRRELTAANQEYMREPTGRSRMRLALILALPGTFINDDGRAASLLEPLAASAGASPLRQFAWLLHGQVSERAREQKRVAQLKEQIEGLRAIERSLIERDKGRK